MRDDGYEIDMLRMRVAALEHKRDELKQQLLEAQQRLVLSDAALDAHIEDKLLPLLRRFAEGKRHSMLWTVANSSMLQFLTRAIREELLQDMAEESAHRHA